jgi:hypothetical protein
MRVGNPISGATFPQEFYPAPWGEIGQFFPPGAGATLLKDVVYFPDANPAFPILVLSCWAIVGLVLVIVGHFRDQAEVETVEERDEEAAAPVAA